MVKTKMLISLEVRAKLICVFGFAYADCWFSHEVAQVTFYTIFSQQTNFDHCLPQTLRLHVE